MSLTSTNGKADPPHKPDQPHRIHRPFAPSFLGGATNYMRSLVKGPRTAARAREDSASTNGDDDDRLSNALALELMPAGCSRLATAMVAVVLGCGTQGSAIAGELLRRGFTVRLCDVSESATNLAREKLHQSLLDFRHMGLLGEDEVTSMISRCIACKDLDAAVDDAFTSCPGLLFIEALPDTIETKQAAFAAMASACASKSFDASRVLFFSNTLSVQVADAAARMPPRYAQRTVGVRFLYPCWFIDDLEITASPWPDGLSLVGKVEVESAVSTDMSVLALIAPHPPHAELAARQLLGAAGFHILNYTEELDKKTRRKLTYEDVVVYTTRRKQALAKNNVQAPAEGCTLGGESSGGEQGGAQGGAEGGAQGGAQGGSDGEMTVADFFKAVLDEAIPNLCIVCGQPTDATNAISWGCDTVFSSSEVVPWICNPCCTHQRQHD